MKSHTWHLIPLALWLLLTASPALADDVATGVTVVISPNAPSNLTAMANSQTQVVLSWTDNADGMEDGFVVERKTGVSGTYAEIGTTASGVATYVDNSVSAGTVYFYEVAAFAGIVDSAYSNETSVTTPSPAAPPAPPSTGSSGGSGGGPVAPVSTNNNVTITGWAYPLSEVTILQNGVEILQTIADPAGVFFGAISDFPNGSYNFSVYATDSSGRKSTAFTFPVTVTTGATTNISNILLTPTVGIDKTEVKRGDPLVIFGESVPKAPITIEVDSAVPIFAHTSAASSGAYVYDLDTSQLEIGSHIAKTEAAMGGLLSGYGTAQAFTVGNENIAAPSPATCPAKGDFNGDCKVNLVDFSMLAYWYGKANAPAIYHLDKATTIDLADFSILAYYWTG